MSGSGRNDEGNERRKKNNRRMNDIRMNLNEEYRKVHYWKRLSLLYPDRQSVVISILIRPAVLAQSSEAMSSSVSVRMSDRSSMSKIFGDHPKDNFFASLGATV